MPTPEARALAEEVFYMDTPEEVALALDRFAAQRGAAANTAARTIMIEFDDIDTANRVFEAIEIIMEDADPEQDGTLSISSPSTPPQTGGGDALPKPTYALGREPCGECHLRPGEVCDICGAIMSDQLTGRPLEQVLYEFLCASDFSYQAFFSALKRFAAQRGAVPSYCADAQHDVMPPGPITQTGGGDAPRRHLTRDEVRIMDKALLASSTLIHSGELVAGGDAGERARAAVEALPSHLFDRKHTEEIALNLTPEFEDALRSSHREGAEAMREACARIADIPASDSRTDVAGTAKYIREAIRALPIPGKTDG